MRHIPNAETRLIVAGNCRTALIPWSVFSWTDAHIPRTEKPVRFRRVAIRKRDAWGMGWDHFSKSETFRYGY
jgi:hypothetical protein